MCRLLKSSIQSRGFALNPQAPELQLLALCQKEKDTIEYLGLIYGAAKDIKDYLTYDEETKVVDGEWLEKSGFGEKMRNEGYSLHWSKPEKIESRILDGYKMIYEIDRLKRVKRRIEWISANDSLLLLGKKKYDDK